MGRGKYQIEVLEDYSITIPAGNVQIVCLGAMASGATQAQATSEGPAYPEEVIQRTKGQILNFSTKRDALAFCKSPANKGKVKLLP